VLENILVAKKVGGIFDSMSDDDDEFFTPSVNKTISKSAEPKETKKELSESDKKALRFVYTPCTHTIQIHVGIFSAAVFDTGEKEISFGNDNSDLFAGGAPVTKVTTLF